MEKWKDIPWYEWLYQISNLGRVKSKKRKIETIIKHSLSKRWNYSRVSLSWNSKQVNLSIHRLVAQAFLWLDINNTKIQALHKSEELLDWRLNNSLSNLWVWTAKENSQDMIKKNRWANQWKFWLSHTKTKVIIQYNLDWIQIKEWEWSYQIQRELWIHQWNIIQCCKKQIYKTVWGYKWEYKKD